MSNETVSMPVLTQEIKNRFLSKIAYTANPNSCWEWTANTGKNGYGKVTVESKTILAHRMSFLIHNNTDPLDNVVLHKCDNRKCVIPNLLFLGKHSDNSKDMISKGRGKEQFTDGQGHPNAKLTDEIVLEIRRKYDKENYSVKDLSYDYGIHQSAMSRIVNRKRWTHI